MDCPLGFQLYTIDKCDCDKRLKALVGELSCNIDDRRMEHFGFNIKIKHLKCVEFVLCIIATKL